MSLTLQQTADALFQQKAVQSSRHHRLQGSIDETVRDMRTAILAGQTVKTDVQRLRGELAMFSEEYATLSSEMRVVTDRHRLQARVADQVDADRAAFTQKMAAFHSSHNGFLDRLALNHEVAEALTDLHDAHGQYITQLRQTTAMANKAEQVRVCLDMSASAGSSTLLPSMCGQLALDEASLRHWHAALLASANGRMGSNNAQDDEASDDNPTSGDVAAKALPRILCETLSTWLQLWRRGGSAATGGGAAIISGGDEMEETDECAAADGTTTSCRQTRDVSPAVATIQALHQILNFFDRQRDAASHTPLSQNHNNNNTMRLGLTPADMSSIFSLLENIPAFSQYSLGDNVTDKTPSSLLPLSSQHLLRQLHDQLTTQAQKRKALADLQAAAYRHHQQTGLLERKQRQLSESTAAFANAWRDEASTEAHRHSQCRTEIDTVTQQHFRDAFSTLDDNLEPLHRSDVARAEGQAWELILAQFRLATLHVEQAAVQKSVAELECEVAKRSSALEVQTAQNAGSTTRLGTARGLLHAKTEASGKLREAICAAASTIQEIQKRTAQEEAALESFRSTAQHALVQMKTLEHSAIRKEFDMEQSARFQERSRMLFQDELFCREALTAEAQQTTAAIFHLMLDVGALGTRELLERANLLEAHEAELEALSRREGVERKAAAQAAAEAVANAALLSASARKRSREPTIGMRSLFGGKEKESGTESQQLAMMGISQRQQLPTMSQQQFAPQTPTRGPVMLGGSATVGRKPGHPVSVLNSQVAKPTMTATPMRLGTKGHTFALPKPVTRPQQPSLMRACSEDSYISLFREASVDPAAAGGFQPSVFRNPQQQQLPRVRQIGDLDSDEEDEISLSAFAQAAPPPSSQPQAFLQQPAPPRQQGLVQPLQGHQRPAVAHPGMMPAATPLAGPPSKHPTQQASNAMAHLVAQLGAQGGGTGGHAQHVDAEDLSSEYEPGLFMAPSAVMSGSRFGVSPSPRRPAVHPGLLPADARVITKVRAPPTAGVLAARGQTTAAVSGNGAPRAQSMSGDAKYDRKFQELLHHNRVVQHEDGAAPTQPIKELKQHTNVTNIQSQAVSANNSSRQSGGMKKNTMTALGDNSMVTPTRPSSDYRGSKKTPATAGGSSASHSGSSSKRKTGAATPGNSSGNRGKDTMQDLLGF